MPQDAPKLKLDNTRRYGAEIVTYNRDTEDREEIGATLSKERGARMIHPYNDARTIAGQGTCGIEIFEQSKARGIAPDAIIVNCSGGGLASGISLTRELYGGKKPDIYTSEPDTFDEMKRSLAEGKILANRKPSGSICDALLAMSPGTNSFAILRDEKAQGMAASDACVEAAMSVAAEYFKLTLEPGGAVSLACACLNRDLFRGKTVIAVGSGRQCRSRKQYRHAPARICQQKVVNAMIDEERLAACADNMLADIDIPELPHHYRGKVRDNYDLPDGRRILVASDRVSAFDKNLGTIPCKGQALTQTARFWFDSTRDICPNHVIEYPDPNVVVGRTLRMMPVEVVVRGYLAGTTSTSILSMYKKGQRQMYGHTFLDGMRDNQKLERPIITPTTKGKKGAHDEPLTSADVVAKGLVKADIWKDVCEKALMLFARGQKVAIKRGLILADTKYEFGFDENGRIVLADEIHTPDSSRYWMSDSYERLTTAGEAPERFDKDFIRSWVAERCDPYKDPIPKIPHDVLLDAARVYIHASTNA